MSVAERARLKLEELEELCRRHALPVTVQRRLIFEALALRTDHPTADHVFDDVRKRIPQISRTTVYRVLDTLVQIGIARIVCHPGAAARYEIETQRHHHLVCMKCGKMVDVEDPSLDCLPLPRSSSGFLVEDYSIQFRGLCADCARKPSVRRERPVPPHTPARKTKPTKER